LDFLIWKNEAKEETNMTTDDPTTNPPGTQGTTRRSFYLGTMYAIWGVIAASLGLPAAAYLGLPPKARKDETWIAVGDITYLPPNQPVEMAFRRNRVDGWKTMSEKVTAWVVKTPGGGVAAYGPQCTHLGCAHHWDEARNQFVCPCHNSLFSIDGNVVSGPAPRPLDRYETKIEGNKLLVGNLREGPIV
jgi:menaquinol-cytochrome c reductase iron-sulfur subunit